MQIGVIVYSLSGHTLQVAEALTRRLTDAGHTVTLERVEMAGPAEPRFEKEATLKTAPAVASYAALVFCTPVRGGALPPPVARYLEGLPTLEGQQVAGLTTHFFPARWGAAQTLAQMQKICIVKGATWVGAHDVRWTGPGRAGRLTAAVTATAALFAA